MSFRLIVNASDDVFSLVVKPLTGEVQVVPEKITDAEERVDEDDEGEEVSP